MHNLKGIEKESHLFRSYVLRLRSREIVSSNVHTYVRVFSPRTLKDVERNDESGSSSNQKTLMGLAVETRSVSSGIKKLRNYPRQVLDSDVLKMPASLSLSLSLSRFILGSGLKTSKTVEGKNLENHSQRAELYGTMRGKAVDGPLLRLSAVSWLTGELRPRNSILAFPL